MQQVGIKAFLLPIRDTIVVQYYLGQDDTASLMEGYLIDPLLLPAGVHPPIEGLATITTNIGIVETGKIKLIPLIQNPFLLANKMDYLTKIRAIFTRD